VLGNCVTDKSRNWEESQHVLDVPLLALTSVDVVWIGVNIQPQNLALLQVRKLSHVVAAEGVSHQNVRPPMAHGERSAYSSAMCTLGAHGPRIAKSVPARS